MPNLIKYGMLSATTNGYAGYLVKAQCVFCGRKFGSVEEAKECEEYHIKKLIREETEKALKERENNAE